MRIGIDFDGVLVKRNDIPRKGVPWDNLPNLYAQDAMRELIKKGHRPYVCTNRTEEDWPKIEKWLENNGFPTMKVTNKKLPNTMQYWDDRCVRFTNFQDMVKYVA